MFQSYLFMVPYTTSISLLGSLNEGCIHSLARYWAAASRINSDSQNCANLQKKSFTWSTKHLFCLVMHGTRHYRAVENFTWAFFLQMCWELCHLHEGCFAFLKLFFKFNCPFVIIKQALTGWPWSCVQFKVTRDRTMLDQKVSEVPYVIYRTKKQTEVFTVYTLINL